MNDLIINEEPYNKLLPDGLPIPSSTVISGKGGSGKPLVGLQFVASWLNAGGSVVFVLTSMKGDFVESVMGELYSTNLENFADSIKYLDLDPDKSADEIDEREGLRSSNLLIPEVWDEEINTALAGIPDGGPGILVFAAALNLFLFSPTYGQEIQEKFLDAVNSPGPESYLFTVATSAFRERIADLEDGADNLLYTHMKEMGDLDLEVRRIGGIEQDWEKLPVPLSGEVLGEIKEMAETGKRQLVPSIKNN